MGCTFSGLITGIVIILAIILVVYFVWFRKSGQQGDWQPNQITTAYNWAYSKANTACADCASCGEPAEAANNIANSFVNYAQWHWNYSNIQPCITGKGTCNILNEVINKFNEYSQKQNCKALNTMRR